MLALFCTESGMKHGQCLLSAPTLKMRVVVLIVVKSVVLWVVIRSVELLTDRNALEEQSASIFMAEVLYSSDKTEWSSLIFATSCCCLIG